MVTTTLETRAPAALASGPRTRLLLVLPPLAALVYPWLLAAITAAVHGLAIATPPSDGAVLGTALAIVLCASGLMALSARTALRLARLPDTTLHARARIMAHLAFAMPSLLTAFGNFSGLIHARNSVAYSWPVFWIAMTALVLCAPDTPVGARPAYHRKLVVAHGCSAVIILLLFLLPHIANHLAGLWSGGAHLEVMKTIRPLYRGELIEPLLLVFLLFQIGSGIGLVRRRLRMPANVFGVLQTLTGFYVGIYILGHVTAVLLARAGGTDTDWNWLTGHDRGVLFHLAGSAVVAHYWAGPIAIITHLACGLRAVAIEHGVAPAQAGRIAGGLIGLGILGSAAMLAGLLGFHLA